MYSMRSRSLLLGILVAAAYGISSPTQAATYSFSCLSNTNMANCTDGALHLTMDVTNAGAGLVDFTFRNTSSLGAVISEVYFDDGTLLGISSLTDSGIGVSFTNLGVNPSNLPSANNASPPFATTTGFSADVVKNTNDGVANLPDGGVQEFLTVRFNLINGKTFNDTIDALDGVLSHTTSGGVVYPDLRVGLHVRSFNNGGSESFINVSPSSISAVPEPESYALVLSSFGVLFFALRHRPRM